MNIDLQDKIDRYLLQQMSNDERLSFEKELESNEELKEQFDFSEKLQRALKSRNEKLAAMREWEKDYESQGDQGSNGSAVNKPMSGSPQVIVGGKKKKSGGTSRNKVLFWVSGIAAILMVGFFISKFLLVAPSSGISNIDIAKSVRAGSDNSDIVLLLKESKFEEALSLTEQKIRELKADSLELARNASVDEEQKQYKIQYISDRHNELKMLKAWALCGLEKQDEALKLLDEIRQKDGDYQTQADSLYNQIKR